MNQLEADLALYGVAYERLLPDGSTERLDPTTIRVIKAPFTPKHPLWPRDINGNLFPDPSSSVSDLLDIAKAGLK